MTAWQVEKKLRNLESAPSWLQAFCHDFFCLPPLAAKKSCTPSLWTEARTAPTPPTTWSGRSSPLSQVKRKRKPFWRCFAHLIASAARYLQRKFEHNYELDMSSLTNNEKKPSNLHVLCDFASNSVQLFPQCRKLRRRTAERSVATHKHGTTVDFGGTYIEFSQETTWFMRHLLRCLVREKRCKVEWRKLLRCCLLMTLGLSFFKKQM